MTDLTGAELSLAVARVMGRPCILGALVAGDPATTTCFSTPTNGPALAMLSRYEWRPDQGGAAAWEVLEWAVLRGPVEMSYDGETGGAECVWHPNEIGIVKLASNPAIALCRAVVALGEAG